MLKFLSAIAAIGALCVSANAQPVNNQPGHSGGAENSQTEPNANHQPSALITIQNEIERIARALEAANKKQPPAAEERRAERDLKAQEKIATWGKWLVIVSLFEALITIAGVFLVWRTLIASWTAAKAAEQSVTETRRIGEAQVRAYVSIQRATVEFRTDWVPGEAFPAIMINVQNSGQSPARNFVWRPTVQYFSGNERRQRGFGENWVETPGISIPASVPFESRALVPDMGMVRFAKTNISPTGDVLVRVRIEFSYRDVFDKAINESAYFSGSTFRVPGEQPPNRWHIVILNRLPTVPDWDNTQGFHDQ